MKLTPAQMDRACGVLLGGAAGDALGAGYEFTFPGPDLVPVMKGGGLGGLAPGEWTDDTDQAMAIAGVAATGLDLRTPEALDGIAAGFLEWYAAGPADIGIQTSNVLSLASSARPTSSGMTAAARAVHERTGRSAGNGSLMRTGPVALAYLDDPVGLVEAAMAVSALTHHEDLATEACAVWCLMIRHTVLTGRLPSWSDIATWVPSPDRWREVLAEAERTAPGDFRQNGWSVGALQAAWSAITHTPGDHCGQLVDALGTAVRIGHDTDTVAAIAGALLGARWGASAVPAAWRRVLHGWPGLTAADLDRLGHLIASSGQPGVYGWPLTDRIDYSVYRSPMARVNHPYDDGVLLTDASALDELPEGITAIVSLCLLGRDQVPAGVEHVGYRLIDHAAADVNPNLDFVLTDAARTVAMLRAEGHRVLLHCVAAQSRTPAVGVAYALLLGVPLDEALPAVCSALPAAAINPGFRAALTRMSARGGLSD
ncbi:ADP-ribosylglycohydrolase family protein [Nocardioides ultimimeridianus]